MTHVKNAHLTARLTASKFSWPGRGLLLALISSLLFPVQVHAVLEEVVVTARKQPETLLETPVAVTVLDSTFFEASGFNTMDDVVKFVPGFDYSPTNTTRANGTKIRGISTFSFSDGFESSVATVIDGVVMGREAQGFFDLFDIEALEVIKGPQGTLFGKNASAGVVNIRTKKPDFEFGAAGDFTYGSFNELRFRGSVTGPIVDDVLAYRLTGSKHEYDGKTDNALPGQDDVNNKDTWSLRGKLLYTPTEKLEALLTVDTVKEDNACCIATYRVAGEPSFLLGLALNNTNNNVAQLQDSLDQLGITPGPGNRTVAIFDDRINQESEASGIALELNYEFDWATLTSITAWRDWEIDEFNEADGLSLSDVNNRNGTESSSEQFSQEFRLAGSINDSISYVGGLYFFDQDLDADGTVFIELALPFPPFFNVATNARRTVDTKSSALFGEFTFDLTEKVSLILGGRYTDEEVSATYDRVATPILAGAPFGFFFGPDLSGRETVDDTNFSGRAIVRYFVSDDTMTYLSWSEGYKGAGIDVAESSNAAAITTPGGLPVLPPEIPELWEFGFKTRLFDNRLAINAVLFNQSVEDVQAISTDGQGNTTNLSIDEVLSRGLELDLQYAATDNLTFSATVTYLDVTFEEFVERPDIEGTAYFDVPEKAISFTSDYRFDIGAAGYTGFVRGEYFWQSEKNTSLGGGANRDVGSYGLLNLRAGVSSPDDKYSVTISAENVTDQDYPSFIFGTSFSALDGVSTAQYLGDPAIYNITIGAKF
ncbi:MAG: TonB-dependent receptor [Pseudomonadota bacterium]